MSLRTLTGMVLLSIMRCSACTFLDNGGFFSSLNYPGASATSAQGINNGGQIVGWYTGSSGNQGFLDNGGTFSSINYPGAVDTYVFGINNSGLIVGEAPSVPEPGAALLVVSCLLVLLVWGQLRERVKTWRTFRTGTRKTQAPEDECRWQEGDCRSTTQEMGSSQESD